MLAIEAKTLDPGFRRDDRFRDDSSSIVIRAQAHYCQGYLPEYDNLLFFVTPLRTMSPRFCWGDGIWLHRPKNSHPGAGCSGGFRPHAVCPRNGDGVIAITRPARGDPASFVVHPLNSKTKPDLALAKRKHQSHILSSRPRLKQRSSHNQRRPKILMRTQRLTAN